MSDSKRIPLNAGDEIRLTHSLEEVQLGKWTVTGLTGGEERSQGGSCICYDAVHNGVTGRLKEFYPGDVSVNGRDWLFYFERDEAHQLRPVGQAMTRRFRALCEDFLGAYHTLARIRQESAEQALLNNYIPACQILYGLCGDGTPGSVYVWTPNDRQGKNFQEYLDEVRAAPEQLPEHKLYNILNTLITLSNCIRLLHQAHLLHLDIKPSNFLVLYDPDFNIDSHSISMFDVNTLYSIYSDYPRITGSAGYTAPEVFDGEACIGSDLYSIGAVLYHAIVIKKDTPILYQDDLYDRLEELVSGSKLIQASDSNSNVYLRDCLTTLLRRTLARNADDRYCCCEELIEDLEKARTYLIPDVFSDSLGLRQKLAILDSEDTKDCNPTAAIQDLLFRYPLYTTAAPDAANLNVLVLGSGTYGQLFLDQCLQTGQMLGRRLRISAFSNNPELDCRLYLTARPMLSRFVNVNGSMKANTAQSYGDLDFCPIPGCGEFTRGRSAQTRSALEQILSGCPDGEAYHYIFIALGNDSLNREVAACLTGTMGIHPGKAVVSHVLQAKEEPKDSAAIPVMVARSISLKGIHPDLDRMGFNTHLCWESSLNLDIKTARKKYLEKYNCASSMAYVLSIRSKLASVGICEKDPMRAAELFQQRIVSKRQGEAKELFEQLVTLEHRRWVLEKVVGGWQGLETKAGKPDYAALAARGLTKDNAAKRHPCLVFSTDAAPLSSFTPEQWNTPGDHDKQLDELDKMSVDLHRAFLALARQFLRAQPLKKLNLEDIRTRLTGAPQEVTQEFERYGLCLKNILEGNRNYTRQFSSYESDFKKALEKLDPAAAEYIAKRLGLIRQSITCVIESNLFRDYKRLDEVLVMKIPFILTYQVQPYMAMAFDDGRLSNGKNSAVFSSVASATMVNPFKITYLYYFDQHSQVDLLSRKARSVLNYFTRRNMSCQVAFLIAFAPGTNVNTVDELKARFQTLQETTRLESVKYFAPEDETKAAEWFSGELLDRHRRVDLYDCSVSLFSSSRREQQFLSRFTRKIPNFEFDWKARKFLDPEGCGYLNYIDESAFIRIDDMFALMGAEDNRHYYPEFADVYRDLWKVYTGEAYLSGPYAFTNGVTNWNRMCTLLESFTKENDQICRITYPTDDRISRITLEYFLPDFMYAPLELVLKRFKELGVVLESSSLSSCNSDSCQLTLHAEHHIESAVDELITALYENADLTGLKVDFCAFRSKEKVNMYGITVRRDKLTVKDLKVDNPFTYKALQALSRLHLINQFRTVDAVTDPNKPVVSFRFTSPRMKKLLTTAGEILEVYTYYDVKKQGYFDEIACSFEFLWESKNITNELDCVLVKGFRSIIVECKSRKELSQDHYYKLWAIAEQFGLATQKVLIANTYDTSNATLVSENELNRTRGRQLGIITISDPKEIRDIGATLRAILEGTYHQES